MRIQQVKRSGSPGTVFAAFLHFDLCFTIWVLLGALGVFIAKDLHLTVAQKGLIVAIPTLSGSVTRIFIGFLSDHFSAKRVGTGLLVFLFIPLFVGWLFPLNFSEFIAFGLMLGVAGASFAVALPLASRWYPPSRQGLVMGITAVGNIGTVIANLFAPRIAASYGWHAVLGLTNIPLVLVLLIFLWLAKDSPARPEREVMGKYLQALKKPDLWWFCLFYSITFGGFVGLGTFLPIFFNSQYRLSAIDAGTLTAVAAFMGSTLRPLGGYLADIFGGTRILALLLVLTAAFYVLISLLLPLGIMGWVMVMCVTCLGMGSGAVFQLVPRRFYKELGIATGITGALGGLGGFFLPTLLGSVKQLSGSFSAGFVILACICLIGLIILCLLAFRQKDWRSSWNVQVLSEAEESRSLLPIN